MKNKIIKNIPNILTALRIVLVLISFILFIFNYYRTSIIIFIISAITDMLDGNIARMFHLETKFGATFDNVADKIYEIILLAAILISKNYFFLFNVLLELIYGVVYFIAMKRNDKILKTRVSAKVKTTFLFITEIFAILAIKLNLMIPCLILIFITGITQVINSLDYYKTYIKH